MLLPIWWATGAKERKPALNGGFGTPFHPKPSHKRKNSKMSLKTVTAGVTSVIGGQYSRYYCILGAGRVKDDEEEEYIDDEDDGEGEEDNG